MDFIIFSLNKWSKNVFFLEKHDYYLVFRAFLSTFAPGNADYDALGYQSSLKRVYHISINKCRPVSEMG